MILFIRITATGQSWRLNARNVSTIESVESASTTVRMQDGTQITVPVAVSTITDDIETAAASESVISVNY